MSGHIEHAGLAEGLTLVFIHGGGINRKMWIREIENLAGEYRAIALDLPGHGVRRNENFSFEQSVTDVIEAIEEHTTGPVVLVGLSLGGYVALAAQHPRVAALVLSGASASYEGWGGTSTKLYGWALTPIAPLLRRVNEKSLRGALDPSMAEAIITHGLSMKSAARALRSVPGRDYRDMLARFEGPVLLLNGERDKPNREEEAAAAAAAKDATVVMVEDSGHACALTQPEAFSYAIHQFCKDRLDGG